MEPTVSESRTSKLVIDNDAGADDAMAIFLALLYEKHYNGPHLVGLTTGNGNTAEDNVYINNQRILRIANRQDVPIYRGSKSSLVTTPDAGAWFGDDGLGDSDLNFEDLVPAQEKNAVEALIDLSKTHKGNLTILTIGTLTNVALAIKTDPEFLDRLEHLYVAAGHIHDEETPEAEFNAHMDVEAYHVVAKHANPDKVTFIPFSQVMTHLNLSRTWREEVFGVIDTDIVKALNKFEKVSLPKSDRWDALDPAAVAVVVKPSLVGEYRYSQHGINLCESRTSKLVIDNDAGADDAMAIFLALLYEKHYNGPHLVGLTTGNGNTAEDNVYINNQRILRIANRQDVPIYRGSKSSLVTTPDAGAWFGDDGLGDSDLNFEDLVPAQEKNAVEALIDLSKTHKGNLTILTIGTLTNVALAIKTDPEFLDRLEHLYVAAGHIHDEETPEAEFNAHMDVEAYHVVAKHANPDKVTFIPFSQVMTHLNLSRTWREEVFGVIDTDIVKALNKFEKVSLPKSDRWDALDPAAVAVVVKPSLVGEYRYSQHGINLCGDRRGITTNTFVDKADANARIVHSYREEDYNNFLLDLFSKK